MNHNDRGKASLEDPIAIIGNMLHSLGHTAVWPKNNDHFITRDCGYNVIVEGFNDACIKIIKQVYKEGARFICIATEEPTPLGFNWGRDREMRWRQKTFPEAAQFFDAILHLVPGQNITNWYDQWAPAAYIELGYAPTLYRPSNIVPPYDFGFFGSVSRRRYQIIKRLDKLYRVLLVHDFPDLEARDRAVYHCKCILQLRKNDSMGLVSSSRCNTSLMCGRPILAEPHQLSKPWDEIVRFSPTMEKFYDDCMFVRGVWEGMYQDQIQKFKTLLPAQVAIAPALKKIGIDLSKPKFQLPVLSAADTQKLVFPRMADISAISNKLKTDTIRSSVRHWVAPQL